MTILVITRLEVVPQEREFPRETVASAVMVVSLIAKAISIENLFVT
jgi:hypothetical protein